jgi:hypothetical protein
VSVGLYLRAKFDAVVPDPDALIRHMMSWMRENYPQLNPQFRQNFADTKPTFFCRLHPAAEEVEFTFVDGLHLTASANTSTVGPGYHIFVCDLLHAFRTRFSCVMDGG